MHQNAEMMPRSERARKTPERKKRRQSEKKELAAEVTETRRRGRAAKEEFVAGSDAITKAYAEAVKNDPVARARLAEVDRQAEEAHQTLEKTLKLAPLAPEGDPVGDKIREHEAERMGQRVEFMQAGEKMVETMRQANEDEAQLRKNMEEEDRYIDADPYKGFGAPSRLEEKRIADLKDKTIVLSEADIIEEPPAGPAAEQPKPSPSLTHRIGNFFTKIFGSQKTEAGSGSSFSDAPTAQAENPLTKRKDAA